MVATVRGLSPEMQKTIVVVGGIAAAAGPLLIVIGKILTALPKIKIAIAALSGPVGAITLAIVGLTAGIVYFVNRANEATTASEALAEVNNRVEASVRREIAELNKLISISRDETKAKETRLEAIRKINAISPEHLGFIELETVNTDAATNAVNSYTTAIEKNARQKAISDKISKLYSAQLDYEEKIARETQKIEEDKAKGWLASNFVLRSAFKTRRAEFQRELDNINASIEAHESLAEQYVKTGETGAAAAAGAASAVDNLATSFKKLSEAQDSANNTITPAPEFIDVAVKQAEDIPLVIEPEIKMESFLTQMDVVKEKIAVSGEQIGNMLAGGIADFAGSIGDAFAGNWDGLGANLLSAVGKLAQQFGSLVIGMAVAALKLKEIIIGNPLAAIAAGAALVALGALASRAAQNMISSGTGGGGYSSAPSMGNTSPGYGPSEYRGAYQDDFQVTFKIGTNELVGVLNTAEQRRNRI
jgi:hypothetical protein